MQFSNTSTYDGICEEIDFWVNTDTTSYPLVQKTRNINRHYDAVVSLILKSDGKWEWDDTNQTDLPIATTALVANQKDYSISGATFLNITRVDIFDSNGNGIQLVPMTQEDKRGTSLDEFCKEAGVPRYYDKIGSSIFLYPKPNYAYAAGLKVYFQRNVSYFLSTDTTKEPGFAAPFHRRLSLGGALDYAMANEMNSKISMLLPQITAMDNSIVEFYSQRDKDEKISLKTQNEDYGSEMECF